MANLCIIPARGGSLRIPRKNIREFLGKPIIAYSIETAIKSGIFDEIMVSTDNQEIAEIANSYSAKVPFLRSEKNSSNDATTFDVIKEVVTHYNIKNQLFQHICCLYPCAPFVKSEDLISGLEKLVSGDYDSVFPIVSYDFPIERALKVYDNGNVYFNDHTYSLRRSQDLEKYFHDAGQYYWMQVDSLSKGAIVTNNSGYMKISRMNFQDIDDITDWNLAELKYQLLERK